MRLPNGESLSETFWASGLPLVLGGKLLEHLFHLRIDSLGILVRFATDRIACGTAPNVSLVSRVADVDDESSNRNSLHLSNRGAAASPTSPARSPTPASQARGVELGLLGDRAVKDDR